MGRIAIALLTLGLVTAPAAAEARTPPANTATAPAGATTPPAHGDRPPPYYYVEPATSAPAHEAASRSTPGAYEPPPPAGFGPDLIYEPPPPPIPHHIAPKTSLWLGARLGWFVPFGNLWNTCAEQVGGVCQAFSGTQWSAYASSGPMFEIDAGARLDRNYNLFALWEHASLGSGSAEPDAHGGQSAGSTDFYGVGLRVSSNPDSLGFLTEVDLGYRRFHAVWADGSELQLTNAPFEFRLGLGADIRVSRGFTLTPMATVGAGAFGTAKRVVPGGSKSSVTPPFDGAAGHGWVTLQLGGHFDIAGSKN